jgi:hypothetical protein
MLENWDISSAPVLGFQSVVGGAYLSQPGYDAPH